jgi:hypothetical protein
VQPRSGNRYYNVGPRYAPYASAGALGWGLGYYANDPWGWYPGWGGYGYPGVYGYNGWGGYGGYGYAPYAGGVYGPGGVYGYDTGRLRLQVRQRDAEVYVDGYYAGVVDDFDGTFQRLRLMPGNHSLVLYHAGHRRVEQKIHVGPGHTLKLKYAMEPLAEGEVAEPPPEEPRATAAASPVPPRVDAQRAPAPPPPPAQRVSKPLTPSRFGHLVLHAQPRGLEVWIDGSRWPADLEGSLTLNLPEGVHSVELRRAGHEPFETELEIRAGEARELNVQLPESGSSL